MDREETTPNGGRAGSDRQVRLLVGGEETGGRFALIELVESRGAGPPRHLHHWEDEAVYVLTGEVTFHRDDQRIPGPAGTCVNLPRGHEHTWRVESTEARLLVAIAPAGLETAYQDVAWGDQMVEQLVVIAARYGVEVTGPPLGP